MFNAPFETCGRTVVERAANLPECSPLSINQDSGPVMQSALPRLSNEVPVASK